MLLTIMWTCPNLSCVYAYKNYLPKVTLAKEGKVASAKMKDKRKRERPVLLPASRMINELVRNLGNSCDRGAFS